MFGFTIDASASMKLKFNGGAVNTPVGDFSLQWQGGEGIATLTASKAIRNCQAKGKFAGGPVSFKIEGFLQVLKNCKTDILMPTTISSSRQAPQIRAAPKAFFKYRNLRKNSFLVACCALIT